MNKLTHTKFEMSVTKGRYVFCLHERLLSSGWTNPHIYLSVEADLISYLDPFDNSREYETPDDMLDITDALSIVRSLVAFHSDFLQRLNIEVDPTSLPVMEVLELPIDFMVAE